MGKKSRKTPSNQADSDVDESVPCSAAHSLNDNEDVFPARPVESPLEDDLMSEKKDDFFSIQDSLDAFSGGPLRIHVNNVGFSTTDDDIEKFFIECNPVKIKIVRGTGNSRCFCFVDFLSKDDFIRALQLDKSMLNGRKLHIRIAEKHVSRHYSECPAETKPLLSPAVRKLRETNSTEEGMVSSLSTSSMRPRLVIAPRSLSTEQETPLPARNPSIFGGAMPVDTASKDRETEELLLQRQRTLPSQSSEERGAWREVTLSNHPGKRLNMYKSKCGTSVSITSPGLMKNKGFFNNSTTSSSPPRTASHDQPQAKTKSSQMISKTGKEPLSVSTKLIPNFWDQRKEEQSKLLMVETTTKKTSATVQPPGPVVENVWQKHKKQHEECTSPVVLVSPKKLQQPLQTATVAAAKTQQNIRMMDASSENSKIAMAAVVSVAKLHQKSPKLPMNKGAGGMVGGISPMGPFMYPVPGWGASPQQMAANFSMFPPTMFSPYPMDLANGMFMPDPTSVWAGYAAGAYPYQPADGHNHHHHHHHGHHRGGKFAKNSNSNKRSLASTMLLDMTAPEFYPDQPEQQSTGPGGGGVLLLRQMKGSSKQQFINPTLTDEADQSTNVMADSEEIQSQSTEASDDWDVEKTPIKSSANAALADNKNEAIAT